ncbi:hypothetical protein [Lewinella sp. LCG006]|uniref:hypothetical protein n=1 Tax=Lewinella sp. LCG006 TaxID=3231911 RepID=UPI003460A33B
MRYLISITAVLAMLFFACEPNISIPSSAVSTIEAQQLQLSDNGLLLEETLLDKMMLPVGTKVIKKASDPTQIQFELPEGYAFLTLDAGTGLSTTTFSGSYLGVINTNNDILTTQKVAYQASLSPSGGLDAFFELEEVVQQINEHYEFIYKHIERPDFSKIEGSEAPEGYAFVPVTLYGVSFALVVPDEESLKTFFPDIQMKKAISFTRTGNNISEYKKHCTAGNCVYY